MLAKGFFTSRIKMSPLIRAVVAVWMPFHELQNRLQASALCAQMYLTQKAIDMHT